MCMEKKVKLINHDCLLILVLLYIMLYIVLAYNASFLPIISAIAFYFHVLSWFIDT